MADRPTRGRPDFLGDKHPITQSTRFTDVELGLIADAAIGFFATGDIDGFSDSFDDPARFKWAKERMELIQAISANMRGIVIEAVPRYEGVLDRHGHSPHS